MGYFFDKTVSGSMDQVQQSVTEVLKSQGFGILTEIDVKETLAKKLQVKDFRPYKILGACNPPFAYDALQAEPNIGLMLPCNFVLQEHDTGSISVSVIDPAAAMGDIDNPDLLDVASKVRQKLLKVIEKL